MIRQKPLNNKCLLCDKEVRHMYHKSNLSGQMLCISVCPDKHVSPQVLEDEEVCPYCQTQAVLICNCMQQTKKCINGHSWLVCKRCKHVTMHEKNKHIVKCEKCNK